MTSQLQITTIKKPKYNKDDYVKRNDYLYSKSLTELNISKDANILLPTNEYIFAYKKNATKFDLIPPDKIQTLQSKTHNHLYEVVNSETPIHGYIDFETPDKDSEQPTGVSFNYLTNLGNDVIQYLKESHHFTQKLTFTIHISIHPNDAHKKYSPTDEFISSAHIIFNFIVNGVKDLYQLFINEFVERYTQYKQFIDKTVYSERKRIRTLYQTKEQLLKTDVVNGKVLYKYILPPHGEFLELKTVVNKHDLISVVVPDDTNQVDCVSVKNAKQLLKSELPYYIDIPIQPHTELFAYNFTYNINQSKMLIKFINNLKEDDYTNTSTWNSAYDTIITAEIMAGVKWENLHECSSIKLFLTNSRIGKYDTDEYFQKNISKLNDRIKKQTLYQHFNKSKTTKKFIEPLKYSEIVFIYKKLNLSHINPIVITTTEVNNDNFLEIKYLFTDVGTPNELCSIAYYSQKTQIILVNPIIGKAIDGKIINQTHAQQQYQYTLDQIMNTPRTIPNIHGYNLIEVSELSQVPINPNISSYYSAAVGAGKSYHLLLKEVLAILKASPTNKIEMITDSITFSHKLHEDVVNLIEEHRQDFSRDIKVALYRTHKVKKGYDNIDIFICCYDSILKHNRFNCTHVMIDEFVNVNKRINSTQKKGYEKSKLCSFYFSLCRSKILKLYDADIDEHVLDILHIKENISMTIYNLVGHIQNNKHIELSNETDMISEICENISLGRNVSISSSGSIKSLKKLGDLLFTKYNIKGVLITGAGASILGSKLPIDENLKNMLSEKTDLWMQYQLFMYSPAFTCGMSFNNKTHFFKHYHFIQTVRGADATQNAQMIYRVRENITKTIQVCVLCNKLNTLKDVSIKNMLYRKMANTNTLIDNCINNKTTDYESIQQDVIKNQRHQFVVDSALTLQQLMFGIEEKTDLRKEYSILFDFFSLLFKYGSIDIICKFYTATYDASIILNDDTDTAEITKTDRELTNKVDSETLFEHKDITTFFNAKYLESIDKSIDTVEYTFDKNKTFFYKKYNITYYIWEYFNTIYKIKLKLQNRNTSIIYDFTDILKQIKCYIDCNFTEIDEIAKLCNQFIVDEIPDIEVVFDELTNTYFNINDMSISYTEDELDQLNNSTVIDDVNIEELLIKQNIEIDKCLLYLNYYNIKELIPKKSIEPIEPITPPIITENITSEIVDLPATAINPIIASKIEEIKGNQVDNAVICYDNSLRPLGVSTFSIFDYINIFRYSKNIAYFPIRGIIYKIYNNLFKTPNKTLIDIQTASTTNNDYLYFTSFIHGTYVCFKIFDMLNITYNDLQLMYSSTTNYKILIDKTKYSEELSILFKSTQNISDYLLAMNRQSKYEKDLQHEQQFKQSLSQLNLDLKLGEIRDDFAYIFRDKDLPPFRVQQISYYNSTAFNELQQKLKSDFKINIPKKVIENADSFRSNSLDDMLFHLTNDNTLIYNDVIFRKDSCIPKIVAYNPITYESNENDVFYANNNNANTNYLQMGITLCCSDPILLIEDLIKYDETIIKNPQINIITESTTLVDICLKNKRSFEKQRKLDEKELEKQRKLYEKELEKQCKLEDKRLKAIETKLHANDTKPCDICGKLFSKTNLSKHKKTHLNIASSTI